MQGNPCISRLPFKKKERGVYMATGDVADNIITGLKSRAAKSILNPLNELIDAQVTDIVTTIGSFVIRQVRGKLQRSITFTVGSNYFDNWMEEALYAILYKYNDINKKSKLRLSNVPGVGDGSAMYYKLDDGVHNLKYRKWDIMLVIQSGPVQPMSRGQTVRSYTIISYDLSTDFVTSFERDMVLHRNDILSIKKGSPTVNVYMDLHEADGRTYWEKVQAINKRSLSTIYIPDEQKRLLVSTINNFFASKKMYRQHGIPWNLKILLYGAPGTGKSSIVKMIASEWNRNIYECTGGKNGKFIPNAITDNGDAVVCPLFSISDIDKYPALINEPDIDVGKDGDKEDRMVYKQTFNNMINALDGILSGEGRIIIMTTNHIEKFSDTILRPGRIDLKMEIGYVTPDVFRKYVKNFYDIDLPSSIKLKRDNLTIADMQADILFYKLSAEQFVDKYAVIE